MLDFIKIENPEEYDSFLKENNAPFTQASFYGKWHRSMGSKVHNYSVKNDSGETLIYIQFLESNVGFGQKFLYAPYGPVLSSKVPVEDLEKILLFLKENLKKVSGELNAIFFRLDFSNAESKEVRKAISNIFKKSPKFTKKGSLFQPRSEWVLNLEKPEDDLFSDFNSKTRYCVRLAEKKNVITTVITENIQSEFEGFYDLMSVTANRNGFSLHKKEYYNSVFKEIDKDGNGYLVKSTVGGEVDSYLLIIIFGETAMFLYGASGDKNRKIPSSHLAQWISIKQAKERGVKFYNFGGISTEKNPDSSLDDLTRFKTRFGGKNLEHSDFYDIINKRTFYLLFLFKKLIGNLKK